MAPLAGLPGVNVHIISKDRKPLAEYYDEQDGPGENATALHTNECYIEAKSNAAFGIRLQVDRACVMSGLIASHDLALFTDIDGDTVDRQLVTSQHFGLLDIFCAHRSDGRRLVQQDYHFSPLTIVEDSGKKPDAELAMKLAKTGTITFKLYRCIMGQPVAPAAIGSMVQETGVHGPISEKALKGRAISHSVKLGTPRYAPLNVVTTTYIDQTNRPLANFTFRYRSHSALQALGLIPQEPAAVPLEDRPLESLDVDEMRELLRRQRVNNEELRNLKRKIKEERQPTDTGAGSSDEHRPKRPRNGASDIEIVDLT